MVVHSEALYESDELLKDARDSAALLASKVYYFLGEYSEALTFALGAGSAFEAEARAYGSEEYVETVVCEPGAPMSLTRLLILSPTIAKAIDRYIELRSEEPSGKKVDPRLQRIIEGIFKRCVDEGEFKQVSYVLCSKILYLTYFRNCFQAIGIALESRRLDIISSIYETTQDTLLLTYAMEAVLDNDFSLSYRHKVLHFLLPLFPQPTTGNQSTHVHSLTRLLITLSDPSLTSSLLVSLVPQDKLLAYQFAFDLVEGGAQDFLEGVRSELPEGSEVIIISVVFNCSTEPRFILENKRHIR